MYEGDNGMPALRVKKDDGGCKRKVDKVEGMHRCSAGARDTHGPRRALLAPAGVLVIVNVTI